MQLSHRLKAVLHPPGEQVQAAPVHSQVQQRDLEMCRHDGLDHEHDAPNGHRAAHVLGV